MISTRKAHQIRAGFQYAHAYDPQDVILVPWTVFRASYKRERMKMKLMDTYIVGQERENYQKLVLAGSLGFMNKNTREAILSIEGRARRKASEFINLWKP